MVSWPVIHRVSDTRNGYGMRECDAQQAALVAPCWILINSYLCVTDTYQLQLRTAMDSWPVIHRVSDTRNGYGMRECDAQQAALGAPCLVIIKSYLCLTDTFLLHTRTTAWTHGR